MKITLNENIRSFRKSRRLTQEQLAEALNVTVGAVSKWESAASIPDISLIVEMASFFETSVDVLLGYDLINGGMGLAIETIRRFRNEKRFLEASAEVEKALKKYPNSFELVFQCAILYSLKGIEQHEEKSYRRSLALFNRSLELIGQNTKPEINEWSIKNRIAGLYLKLNQNDEALEMFKKNNADGLNDESIGTVLSESQKKPEEALPYLSKALISDFDRLLKTVFGFAGAFEQLERYDEALELLVWLKKLLDGLRVEGKVSYMDNLSTQVSANCALFALYMNDADLARAYLEEAKAAAELFDASPDYGFKNTKYFHSSESLTAFDDFGSSAKEGITRTLEASEINKDIGLKIWKEINGGKENDVRI